MPNLPAILSVIPRSAATRNLPLDFHANLQYTAYDEMKTSKEQPLVQKVDCVRLYVSNLDAGLAFYRDQLGHKLIWRTDEAVGLRLGESDTEIVLHLEPGEPEIDLQVDSADEAAMRFEEAGGKIVVPPFDIQIGRAVVVQDPWGNQVVLLDSSKGLLVTDAEGNVLGNVGQRLCRLRRCWRRFPSPACARSARRLSRRPSTSSRSSKPGRSRARRRIASARS